MDQLQPLTSLPTSTSPSYSPSPTHSHTYLTTSPSLPSTPRLLSFSSRPSSTTRLANRPRPFHNYHYYRHDDDRDHDNAQESFHQREGSRRRHQNRGSHTHIPTSTSTPTFHTTTPSSHPPRRRLRPLTTLPTAAAAPHSSTPNLAKRTSRTSRGYGNRATFNEDGGEEEDWLTRTASTLALARLEDKGCSWLVQRESSTSLSLGGGGGLAHDEDGGEGGGFVAAGHGAVGAEELEEEGGSGYAEGEGPDFVEGFGDDDDDYEGEEEAVVDESEIRKVVMGRVGGWVDWAVGWMDFRGDEDGEEGEGEGDGDGRKELGEGRRGFQREKKDGPPVQGPLDVAEVERRLKGSVKDRDLADEEEAADSEQEEEDEEPVAELSSPPPPALDGTNVGLVSDARWLLGVMARDIAL